MDTSSPSQFWPQERADASQAPIPGIPVKNGAIDDVDDVDPRTNGGISIGNDG